MIELQAVDTVLHKATLLSSESGFTDFPSASEFTFDLCTDTWILKSLRCELPSAHEAAENSRTGTELLEKDSEVVLKILFRKVLNILF